MLGYLADVIWTEILSTPVLNVEDILRLAQVSKSLCALVQHDWTWQRLAAKLSLCAPHEQLASALELRMKHRKSRVWHEVRSWRSLVLVEDALARQHGRRANSFATREMLGRDTERFPSLPPTEAEYICLFEARGDESELAEECVEFDAYASTFIVEDGGEVVRILSCNGYRTLSTTDTRTLVEGALFDSMSGESDPIQFMFYDFRAEMVPGELHLVISYQGMDALYPPSDDDSIGVSDTSLAVHVEITPAGHLVKTQRVYIPDETAVAWSETGEISTLGVNTDGDHTNDSGVWVTGPDKPILITWSRNARQADGVATDLPFPGHIPPKYRCRDGRGISGFVVHKGCAYFSINEPPVYHAWDIQKQEYRWSMCLAFELTDTCCPPQLPVRWVRVLDTYSVYPFSELEWAADDGSLRHSSLQTSIWLIESFADRDTDTIVFIYQGAVLIIRDWGHGEAAVWVNFLHPESNFEGKPSCVRARAGQALITRSDLTLYLLDWSDTSLGMEGLTVRHLFAWDMGVIRHLSFPGESSTPPGMLAGALPPAYLHTAEDERLPAMRGAKNPVIISVTLTPTAAYACLRVYRHEDVHVHDGVYQFHIVVVCWDWIASAWTSANRERGAAVASEARVQSGAGSARIGAGEGKKRARTGDEEDKARELRGTRRGPPQEVPGHE